MRATVMQAINGQWAVVAIRVFVLPLTLLMMSYIASELVSMRDGVRDLQAAARELRAQIMDIRQDANAAMKDAEQFRRASLVADAETKTKLQSFETALKALQDQVAAIWRKSELERNARAPT